MQLTLTIPGSIVSKKNSKIACMIGGKNCPRRPMILPSKAYSKWEKQGREALLWQKWPDIPLTCPVHVNAHFYYKGNKPDLAGAMESISDCLQGIIWANDGQIESWDGSRCHHDLKNPRTDISVWWNTCHDEEKK